MRPHRATEARDGFVVCTFTPEEARDLAHLYGPGNGAYQELLDAADEAEGLDPA